MAITLKNREDFIKASKDFSVKATEKAKVISINVAKTISKLCDQYVENMSTKTKSSKASAKTTTTKTSTKCSKTN